LTPGVSLRLRAPKPEVERDEGDSLGSHLRRRRRELGLRRIDVAQQLGADPRSLMWWERDERQPFVSFYPVILGFLGYEPWPEPETLAEALLAERRRRGLSREGAAALVGVDEATLWRWENAEWKPTQRTAAALDGFLGYAVKERFPREVR
jgi:transcriptional regulator with XRE-family HTH domain